MWGGYRQLPTFPPSREYFDTGGRYNPVTNTWQRTSVEGAPFARADASSVWTGAEMIIFSGIFKSVNQPIEDYVGARYNPATNTWRSTSTVNAPAIGTGGLDWK